MPGIDEKTGQPMIGDDTDFEGPKDNSPRGSTVPRKAAKIEQTLNEMDESIPDVEAALRESTPEEQAREYRDNLKEVGVTREEALSIQESVMVDGYYEESFLVGKTTVVLRSRLYLDTQRVYQALEARDLALAATIQDFVSRYNLAASIVSIGSRKYPHVGDPLNAPESEFDEAFEKRLHMISRLPEFMASRLMESVFKFDRKMRAIFAEGAPQDF
ncbi:MAG: hypothetical protein DRP01_00230 [Archaeoglobales archaeon]|nr:MAG: hypothetical protein DRP01_00230 [Archaeoglobales archaeon]